MIILFLDAFFQQFRNGMVITEKEENQVTFMKDILQIDNVKNISYVNFVRIFAKIFCVIKRICKCRFTLLMYCEIELTHSVHRRSRPMLLTRTAEL